MENRELYSNDLTNKVVDVCSNLEGIPISSLASKLAYNYLNTFLPSESDFRENQRKSFNKENLLDDPVYNKLKNIYWKNRDNMKRRSRVEENKIANYAFDIAEKLDNRKGLSEKEYGDLFNLSEADLEKKIRNSDAYNWCFFDKMKLMGDDDYNSPIWRDE